MSGPTQPRPFLDVEQAKVNAGDVHLALSHLVNHVKRQYPYRTDVLELIGKVQETLAAEHGGARPYNILKIWYHTLLSGTPEEEVFATPEEKQARLRMCKRWADRERIDEEFWGLAIYEENGLSKWLPCGQTDERLDNAARCLEGWLVAPSHGSKVG